MSLMLSGRVLALAGLSRRAAVGMAGHAAIAGTGGCCGQRSAGTSGHDELADVGRQALGRLGHQAALDGLAGGLGHGPDDVAACGSSTPARSATRAMKSWRPNRSPGPVPAMYPAAARVLGNTLTGRSPPCRRHVVVVPGTRGAGSGGLRRVRHGPPAGGRPML